MNTVCSKRKPRTYFAPVIGSGPVTFLVMIAIADIPWFLLIVLSTRKSVHGLPVSVVGKPEDADDVFRRVAAALDLIDRYGIGGLDTIRNRLKRLLFTETSGGDYHHSIRTCRISVSYARRVPPVDLAMMIVHEATHARLAEEGRKYIGDQREKIERECIAEEVAFAKRIPGTEDVVARTEALLDHNWWMGKEYERSMLSELRARGVPEWIASRLVSHSSRKSQRKLR